MIPDAMTVPPGPSVLADHGTVCCAAVRLGVVSQARSRLLGLQAIAAIPRLIEWDATAWPAHWCDLVAGGRLRGDCGVHADAAAVVARTYGLAVERGFAVLRSGPHRAEHWSARWSAAGLQARWLDDRFAFHELVRIEGIGWWDPSEARPIAGIGAVLEAGSVVALETDWTRKIDLRSHG